MNREGELRKGKFFKNDSILLQGVIIEAFDFSEISEINMAFPDNVNNNIFHKRLQIEDDLSQALRASNITHESLQDPNNRHLVIKPRDFTADWFEEKKRARDRKNDDYDEEDIFSDDVPQDKNDKDNFRNFTPQSVVADASEKNVHAVEHESKAENKSADTQPPKPEPQEAAAKKIVDRVVENIPKSNHDGISIIKDPPEKILHQTRKLTNENIPIHETEAKPEKQPEKEKTEVKETKPPFPEIAPDEIKKKAYEEGFQYGEQKAILEVKEQAAKILDEVQGAMDEIQTFKKQSLQQIQDNFLNVAEALCESILNQQLAQKPENLIKVIEKVVGDTFGTTDSYSIEVNQNLYDSLKKIMPEHPLVLRMRGNKNISAKDFKVESDSKIVDGSLQKIVREMLEKMDLKIFDE